MDRLGSFFYIIRKVIFIIPIGLIVIAVLLYQKTSPRRQIDFVSVTPGISGTIATRNSVVQQTASSGAATKSIQLDLKGPWNCTFTIPEASVSAYISNNRIAADVYYQQSVSHYRVEGDCMHEWTDMGKPGKETCGIGQYIAMAQVAAQTGLLSTSAILHYLPQIMGHTLPVFNQSAIQQSCLNKPVPDSTFVVPQQIRFVKE